MELIWKSERTIFGGVGDHWVTMGEGGGEGGERLGGGGEGEGGRKRGRGRGKEGLGGGGWERKREEEWISIRLMCTHRGWWWGLIRRIWHVSFVCYIYGSFHFFLGSQEGCWSC